MRDLKMQEPRRLCRDNTSVGFIYTYLYHRSLKVYILSALLRMPCLFEQDSVG